MLEYNVPKFMASVPNKTPTQDTCPTIHPMAAETPNTTTIQMIDTLVEPNPSFKLACQNERSGQNNRLPTPAHLQSEPEQPARGCQTLSNDLQGWLNGQVLSAQQRPSVSGHSAMHRTERQARLKLVLTIVHSRTVANAQLQSRSA
jgi:hypothetical protein